MNNLPDITPAPAQKRKGRPVSSTPTKTPAQRQREYRQRLKAQPIEAQGQIKMLGRVALVRMLNACFAELDDAGQDAHTHDLAKWQVQRIMRELITRYDIKPE